MMAFGTVDCHAYSAVAFSRSLGYGYCYDRDTKPEAATCALNYCRQNASDPDTCGVAYSGSARSNYALAIGKHHWGIGSDDTSPDADRAALGFCAASDCTVRVRWSESKGEPDFPTHAPLVVTDPAHTAVLIEMSGSLAEHVPDECHLDRIDGPWSTPSTIAIVDGEAINGLKLLLDRFCTPHKVGGKELKIDLRAADLLVRINAYIAAGIPPQQILLFGHSAGAWASLMVKSQHPALVNAVIAIAPAFAGKIATRNPWWWEVRAKYLARLAASTDLSALVFSFAGDAFEPPDGLGDLARAHGVTFVPVTSGEISSAGCHMAGHYILRDPCFERTWGNTVRNYIVDRLRKASRSSAQ
jgi:hypothetical protein